jgi:hypothetical protein
MSWLSDPPRYDEGCLTGTFPTSWPACSVSAASGQEGATSGLRWESAPYLARARFLAELPLSEARQFSLSFFSKALRSAEILDNSTVNLPGATILLPQGTSLLQRLVETIQEEFKACGLREYDYPFLCPLEMAEPMQDLFPLQDKVLFVGSKSEMANNQTRAFLGPTGEQVIYSHWSKLIRNKTDLPLKMWRRARYFRPAARGKHSGKGVFSTMESADVFESHCSYASKQEALGGFHSLFTAARRVAERWHLPVIWSMRPPWSNNDMLFDWSIGADMLTPLGTSVQVSSVYFQGQKLSRPFGISFREDGEIRHPHQVTTYLSRRVLLAHLLNGLREDGSIVVHPINAPEQVAIIIPAFNAAQREPLEALARSLKDAGIRVAVFVAGDKRELQNLRIRIRNSATPLLVQPSAPLGSGAPKAIITVIDRAEQATVDVGPGLVSSLSQELKLMAERYRVRMSAFLADRMVQCSSEEEAYETLGDSKFVVAPLAATVTSSAKISPWNRGELLGFANNSASAQCITSGQATPYLGIISRRM